jgi:uncharacterized membrane protein YagU involved in acid resistance
VYQASRLECIDRGGQAAVVSFDQHESPSEHLTIPAADRERRRKTRRDLEHLRRSLLAPAGVIVADMTSDTILKDAAAGAVAGLAATLPMTVVMRGLHTQLPGDERYPLPPQRITTRVSRAVGVSSYVRDPHEWEIKTNVLHYGYGTGCGAAYGLLEPHLPGPTIAKGVAFGVGVWAVSYLAWLPAAGIHRPATREPAGRNAVMLLAHAVWGAAAATIFERARRR